MSPSASHLFIRLHHLLVGHHLGWDLDLDEEPCEVCTAGQSRKELSAICEGRGLSSPHPDQPLLQILDARQGPLQDRIDDLAMALHKTLSERAPKGGGGRGERERGGESHSPLLASRCARNALAVRRRLVLERAQNLQHAVHGVLRVLLAHCRFVLGWRWRGYGVRKAAGGFGSNNNGVCCCGSGVAAAELDRGRPQTCVRAACSAQLAPGRSLGVAGGR